MLPAPFENALILTGPTGSGKTQLGIDLARRMNAEIISMDSMALYRGMDICTAKPTAAQRELVPHHLIDVREPWESGSVAWWLDQAKHCAKDIESRGKQVLIVGGTPLYLKALTHGLFEGPPADEAIRMRLTEEAESLGSAALHARLAAVDPRSADRLHPNDVRRMIRALEVFELTGKPMSDWQTQWEQQTVIGEAKALPAILCLDMPREDLYRRIEQRVDDMVANGLIEEVRRLRAMERPLSLEAGQALGYKETLDLLNGTITLEETITRIKTRSRNFAKRQMAWFRHLPHCRFVTTQLTWELWARKIVH